MSYHPLFKIAAAGLLGSAALGFVDGCNTSSKVDEATAAGNASAHALTKERNFISGMNTGIDRSFNPHHTREGYWEALTVKGVTGVVLAIPGAFFTVGNIVGAPAAGILGHDMGKALESVPTPQQDAPVSGAGPQHPSKNAPQGTGTPKKSGYNAEL